jgi:hypothetical protein
MVLHESVPQRAVKVAGRGRRHRPAGRLSPFHHVLNRSCPADVPSPADRMFAP